MKAALLTQRRWLSLASPAVRNTPDTTVTERLRPLPRRRNEKG